MATQEQDLSDESGAMGGRKRVQKERNSGTVTFIPSEDTTIAIIDYISRIHTAGDIVATQRSEFEAIDREYYRKNNNGVENAANETANALGDKSKLRDITIPVVGPQTDSLHSYLCQVFLSGYPIFKPVAPPQFAAQLKPISAIVEDNSTRAGWGRNLAMAMKDGLKYNFMAVEVNWERKTSYSFMSDPTAQNLSNSKSKQQIWAGNVIKRLDPYNTFRDKRVPLALVHEKGEFAGYTEIYSFIALKQLIADLENCINVKEAIESNGPGGEGKFQYFVPTVTNKTITDPSKEENWVTWMGGKDEDAKGGSNALGGYHVTKVYCKILPKAFKMSVPASKSPQIWRFILVNGQILLHAERLTNQHNYLPIIFGQPNEDGLDSQTPSFAENIVDMQDIATKLWNIKVASARRAVMDRMLYDPTKVMPKDINSSNPNAKIPVRPGSYGENLGNVVFPFPYRDDGAATLVSDAFQVVEFARSISGQSRAAEGQFTKGNRTLAEYTDTAGRGDGRNQVIAMFLEAQFYYPIKEIIKANTLQYQAEGEVYAPISQEVVEVNPIELRKAYFSFKMSDGLIPASKMVSMDFLQVLLQVIGSSPEMQQEFDIVALIGYMGTLTNAPELGNFRRGMNQNGNAAPNPTAPSTNGTPDGGNPQAGPNGTGILPGA